MYKQSCLQLKEEQKDIEEHAQTVLEAYKAAQVALKIKEKELTTIQVTLYAQTCVHVRI
jgi:hypothetical protein